MKMFEDKPYGKWIVVNDCNRQIFRGTKIQATRLLNKLCPKVDPFRNWQGIDKQTKSRKGLIYYA